ncbi:MAG: hypothetical protein EPN79_11290 [Burkholderiaceae bacterium]|nr:MAG: hypothetical protein EPN79_11290 [Burkholderiaceae bacterium]TBR76733.1 MAG: hypothetical protein EPN64_05785 [Burkholderiaceae bacterium]
MKNSDLAKQLSDAECDAFLSCIASAAGARRSREVLREVFAKGFDFCDAQHEGPSMKEGAQSAANLMPDVFRDYAIQGQRVGALEVDADAQVNASRDDGKTVNGAYVQSWRYVSNDEIVGFLSAMARSAGLDSSELDEAVHDAAESKIMTQAKVSEIDEISADASSMNNEGLESQVEFLVAAIGAQMAYEAVLCAIKEAQIHKDAQKDV